MNMEQMTELDIGMTNFDHSIDDGLADALKAKAGEVYAQYAGYNFCGYVYFEDTKFQCDVWVYNTKRETISKESLPAIMESVSDKYGDA